MEVGGVATRPTFLEYLGAAASSRMKEDVDSEIEQLELEHCEEDGELVEHACILATLRKLDDEVDTEDSMKNSLKKRKRTSPAQLEVLETIFETDKMPNQTTRLKLAQQLKMSPRRVQIWFQNKRAKMKRQIGSPRNGIMNFYLTSLLNCEESQVKIPKPKYPSIIPSINILAPDGMHNLHLPSLVMDSNFGIVVKAN